MTSMSRCSGATACQPVKIEDEYYWDGGYSGNPAIYPLIYETDSRDVVLVQINPIEAPYQPGASAQEVMERVNEITFNSSLLAEMRAIDFVTRLLEEEDAEEALHGSAATSRRSSGRRPSCPRGWRRRAAERPER